jgi:hypothetical protein
MPASSLLSDRAVFLIVLIFAQQFNIIGMDENLTCLIQLQSLLIVLHLSDGVF